MKTLSFLMAFAAIVAAGESAGAHSLSPEKALVVYFSHSGNTRTLAGQIARAAHADLLEIVPEKPYPTVYNEVTDQAQKEIEAGYRPALATKIPDVSAYDVVFVGSPCWWGTIAPPVAAFLASCDLTGKTVAPFMTHEGSRMGRSAADIRELCPKSALTEGLSVRGSAVSGAAAEVEKWLKKIGK